MHEFRDFLASPGWLITCACLVVILTVILMIMRIIGGGRLLAFNNPTGRVLVDRGAIKGLIARTCATVEGVSHPQSRIRTSGGKLRARVYIQMRGNTRLSDIATLLQDKLDLALRQNLGIERIGKIDVIVTDIQPVAKKPASRAISYPWEERFGGE